MKNLSLKLLILLAFLLVVVNWLVAIRRSQLSPHFMVVKYNGRVYRQWWQTNNEYLGYAWQTNYSSTGAVYRAVTVTNHYWTVWAIFK
jgi:hypothetical protein